MQPLPNYVFTLHHCQACFSFEDNVQIRHRTRLFPSQLNARNTTDRSGNILPGVGEGEVENEDVVSERMDLSLLVALKLFSFMHKLRDLSMITILSFLITLIW